MRYGPILALILAIFAAAAFALPAANAEIRTAQSRRLDGTYICSGTNPNGTGYRGTVVIRGNGGDNYRFTWLIAGSQTLSGVGTLNGNSIVVDWGQAYPVIYRVGADGVLRGTWDNGRATETLTPQ